MFSRWDPGGSKRNKHPYGAFHSHVSHVAIPSSLDRLFHGKSLSINQWEISRILNGGTFVPFFWPYFRGISPYIRPYIAHTLMVTGLNDCKQPGRNQRQRFFLVPVNIAHTRWAFLVMTFPHWMIHVNELDMYHIVLPSSSWWLLGGWLFCLCSF